MGQTTKEAAATVGIAVVTLQRWIAAGLLKAPRLTIQRGRAARLWSESDIERLRKKKEQIYRKGRGRKPGSANTKKTK